MIILQKKRSEDLYSVPNGGEILWYGLSANVPAGFTIDAYCADVFIRGADTGQASNAPVGTAGHTHDLPDTGSGGAHSHSFDGDATAPSSSSEETYPTSNIWSAPTGHDHEIPPGTSSSTGSHVHTFGSTLSKERRPPYKRVYWIKNTSGGDAAFPLNGIMMWDAVIANRPEKFQLCDGNNSTIDLRSNFIYGAQQDSHVGTSGGGLTHNHSNPTMGAAGGHSHSMTVESEADGSDQNISGFAGEDVSAGGHTHTLSKTTDPEANHTHPLATTNDASNLPPYLKLFFIQRIQ